MSVILLLGLHPTGMHKYVPQETRILGPTILVKHGASPVLLHSTADKLSSEKESATTPATMEGSHRENASKRTTGEYLLNYSFYLKFKVTQEWIRSEVRIMLKFSGRKKEQ